MPAASVDEYLAGVPEEQRAALQRLREQIHALVAEATEAISYGYPTFKLNGRWLMAFSASKKHCSFYAGAAPVTALAGELEGYRLWKGTINFQPDKPIPADLVRRLVEVRLAEYGAA